jgi:hypothetical protein
MNENEAAELAKTIDDELEARVINDEITAHVINDEVDAHKINEELTQVAETFDSLDAENFVIEAPSPQAKKMQDMMANFWAAQANHQPGKEFVCSDVTYVVQAYPHKGMWVRKEKRTVTNPNLNNNSVRRKLAKNPGKYNINIF